MRALTLIGSIVIGFFSAIVAGGFLVHVLPGIFPHIIGASLGGFVAGLLAPDFAIWAGFAVGALLIAMVNLVLYWIMKEGHISLPLLTPTAVVQSGLVLVASTGLGSIGGYMRAVR